MAQQDVELIVNGYRFQTVEEAEIARQEQHRISLIEEKLDEDNIASIAMIYEKSVHNQVFVTPIGIAFLTRLQKILEANDRPESLLAIPVPKSEKSELVAEEQEVDSILSKEEENGTARLNIRVDKLEKQLQKKDKQLKNASVKVRNSYIVSGVLVIMVIALFVITIMGENANVLNYKRVLTDRYASWEVELKQREDAVREKENELQIQEWKTEEE